MNDKSSIVTKLKKVGKIICITFLCIIAFIVVSIGIIIFGWMRQEKSSTNTEQTTVTTTNTISENAESEYIDTPTYDEFKLYAANASELPIFLSDNAYASIYEALSDEASVFRMAEYYALDQAMEIYHNTPVNKSTETTLLTNGMLDTEKLIQVVNANNSAVMQNGKNTINIFYTELDDSDVALICEEISKVVNDKSDEFDINRIANTLENLTLFKHTGTTTNAYVSTELAFIYNPITTENYGTIQGLKGGSAENAWEQVIDHEIMHLIQYGASDNSKDNGIETGFCRMYNVPDSEEKLPVDSLYFTWLLEAGAELGMSDYLDIEPGTYEKKISYVRSYNLSRFYENADSENALEKVGFKHTLEEVFDALGLVSESEQLEFLKFMYSIEITQSDPEDFWEHYEARTGKTLSDEEKLGIRMDIRTDAVKYMTTNFFANLTAAIYEGVITDLDTAFYLMRLWELDVFNHLNYTQESSLEHAKEFIIWYSKIQDTILSGIAESSELNTEKVQSMYSAYCLQLEDNNKDNCDLSNLTSYTKEYILGAKKLYRSSNYSRIYDVAKWLGL